MLPEASSVQMPSSEVFQLLREVLAQKIGPNNTTKLIRTQWQTIVQDVELFLCDNLRTRRHKMNEHINFVRNEQKSIKQSAVMHTWV